MTPDAAVDPLPEARRLLHLVSVKGPVSAATAAEVLAVDPRRIAELAATLTASGHLRVDDDAENSGEAGPVLRLTPRGREADDAATARDRERLARALTGPYTEFGPLDRAVKEAVTDWQTVTVGGRRVINRHDDPAHDARVRARLVDEIHPRARALLDRLAAVDRRFADYCRRLDRAAEAVAAGDTSMIARPDRDSYHTVWFELHEELLRLLGRSRADESSP